MSFDDVSLNPSALRASERSQVSAGIARLNRRQLHGGEVWRSHQNCAGTERAEAATRVPRLRRNFTADRCRIYSTRFPELFGIIGLESGT